MTKTITKIDGDGISVVGTYKAVKAVFSFRIPDIILQRSGYLFSLVYNLSLDRSRSSLPGCKWYDVRL